jgi:hypothetical protein
MGDNLPAVALGTGRTAMMVTANSDFTCALLDNATVKCWGRGINGRLGTGDIKNRGDAANEMGDSLAGIMIGWWKLMPDFDAATVPYHVGWTAPLEGIKLADRLTHPQEPTVGAVQVVSTTAAANACLDGPDGNWCELDNDITFGALTIAASNIKLTSQANARMSSLTINLLVARDNIYIDGGTMGNDEAQWMTMEGWSVAGAGQLTDVIVRRTNLDTGAADGWNLRHAARVAFLQNRVRTGAQSYIMSGDCTLSTHDVFFAYNSVLTDGDGSGVNGTSIRFGCSDQKTNYSRWVLWKNHIKPTAGTFEAIRVNGAGNVWISQNVLRGRGPRFSIQLGSDALGDVWFTGNTLENITGSNYGAWSSGAGPDNLYYTGNRHETSTVTQSVVNSSGTPDAGDFWDLVTGNTFVPAEVESAWPQPETSPGYAGDPNGL